MLVENVARRRVQGTRRMGNWHPEAGSFSFACRLHRQTLSSWEADPARMAAPRPAAASCCCFTT